MYAYRNKIKAGSDNIYCRVQEGIRKIFKTWEFGPAAYKVVLAKIFKYEK